MLRICSVNLCSLSQLRRARSATVLCSATTSTVGSQRREFVAQRIADIAATKFDKLSKNLARKIFVIGTEEHRITEAKQPYVKKAAMQESLAQRLELQRSTRQAMTPSTLRVSKCRRYLIIHWNPVANPSASASHQDTLQEGGIRMPSGSASFHDPAPTHNVAAAGGATLRNPNTITPPPTRLLAEFLRSQSTSTDVMGAGVLIYGKRGLTITEVVPHGNYAVRLQFSDDHSGGIFPYDYLNELGGKEKFRCMRTYVKALSAKRKSRVPPVRSATSTARRPPPKVAASDSPTGTTRGGCGGGKR